MYNDVLSIYTKLLSIFLMVAIVDKTSPIQPPRAVIE